MLPTEALEGLSTHDLIVQLVWNLEDVLVIDGVLNADAVATLIEDVLTSAHNRLRH